jgi:hypothetical protein
MNLTQEPEIVTWPETQYVFLEKMGPFENTAPQASKTLHPLVSGISEHRKITGYRSLYKVQPEIDRAGVSPCGRASKVARRSAIFKIRRRHVQSFCLDRILFKLAASRCSRFRDCLRDRNKASRGLLD